jgi:hypothetical protein
VVGGAWRVTGSLWIRRVQAEVDKLSERTRGDWVARSVEDISTDRVASFGGRSVRLTMVARLREDGRVAGDYAKAKVKR